MDRQDLEKKNKADLLALAAAASLATTPALTKADLVELLLANAQMIAASAQASTPPAASPAINPADETNSRIAALEAQLAQALAHKPAAAPVVDPLAVNDPEADRKNPMPKEGALRTLDGKLVDFKRVRVTIMATEGEKEDVKLSLNGHLLQIKRGVPVDIPHHYLGVLRDSTVDTFVKDPESGAMTRVQIQRYPYTVDGLV